MSTPEELHFEDLLSLAGGTGRWQLLLLSWMSLFFLTVPFTCFSIIFMGDTPEFFCVDGHPLNATFESLSETAEHCSAADGQPCRRWLYDPAVPGSSLVTQWDLVCERRPLLSTTQSVLMLGALLGSLMAGGIGDRFGRRVAYLVMLVIYAAGAIASAASDSYEMFLLLRFITGFGWMGVTSCSCVLAVEVTGLRWRAMAGQLLMLPIAIGQSLLAAVAYQLRIWWHLQLALATPLLTFVFSYWIVPESPRWLILRGRDSEAIRVLGVAARVNGRGLPEEERLHKMLKDVRRCELAGEEATTSKGICTDTSRLWQSPRLRRWMPITGMVWYVGAAAYFGVSFDVTLLSESPYLAAALSGVVEAPAYFMAPVQNRFGRRPVSLITFILAGVFMLLVLADRNPTFWLVVGLSAKFCISCVYAMLFVYTPEYIPTSVRTVGFGFANVCSRLGAMSAPYIVDLLREVDRSAPSVVFGSCCLLVGLSTLLLPETSGKRLPETVAELEAGTLDQTVDQVRKGNRSLVSKTDVVDKKTDETDVEAGKTGGGPEVLASDGRPSELILRVSMDAARKGENDGATYGTQNISELYSAGAASVNSSSAVSILERTVHPESESSGMHEAWKHGEETDRALPPSSGFVERGPTVIPATERLC